MNGNSKSKPQCTTILRDRRDLYLPIYKAANALDLRLPSKQGVISTGQIAHPFNMSNLVQFLSANVHHAACIEAKKTSTVGLGFRPTEETLITQAQKVLGISKVPPEQLAQLRRTLLTTTVTNIDELLDPLTDSTFLEIISMAIEDFWNVGNGYLEVVRDGLNNTAPIVGIYYLEAQNTYKVIEDTLGNFHWKITGSGGTDRTFARFGDLERFSKENQIDETVVSEVIHFRYPSTQDKNYGYPSWLAAVAMIELVQCIHQDKYDFHNNRGVPEFLLWICNGNVDTDLWESIQTAIKANIGIGNAHKSFAANLPNISADDIRIDKLGMESSNNERQFEADKQTLAFDIVSAHRVPPLLAGIQVPGKLGANNELPNALMAFQNQVVGPAQKLISRTLSRTLGNPDCNGGLQLVDEDFVFNNVVETMNMQIMDTIGRMRQTVPEAEAEDRDLGEGIKQRGEEDSA